LDACSPGSSFGRQIICCGPQSSRYDNNVRPAAGLLENRYQHLRIIPYSLVPGDRHPGLFQPLCNVGGIAVYQRAGPDLVPGGNNLSNHLLWLSFSDTMRGASL